MARRAKSSQTSESFKETIPFRVMSVYDLEEGMLKDPMFEGLVITRYGTFDRSEQGSGTLRTKHHIINNDLTDKLGLTTVTSTCYGEQLCTKFSKLLVVGNYVRLTDFTMKDKANSSVEKGDIKKSIRIGMGTKVDVIPSFLPKMTPFFLASERIVQFKKRMDDKFACATLAVTVIEVLGQTDRMFNLRIADGILEDDIFILQLDLTHRKLYDTICLKVNNKEPSLLLLKNVSANLYGERTFRTESFTYVSDVQDDTTKAKLVSVHQTLVSHQTPQKVMKGMLMVPSPAVPHFKSTCPKCKYADFVRRTANAVYCNICKAPVNLHKTADVRVAILFNDDQKSFHATLAGKWSEQMLDMTEVEFMKLGDKARISKLTSLTALGRFSVSVTGYICDFISSVNLNDGVEDQAELRTNSTEITPTSIASELEAISTRRQGTASSSRITRDGIQGTVAVSRITVEEPESGNGDEELTEEELTIIAEQMKGVEPMTEQESEGMSRQMTVADSEPIGILRDTTAEISESPRHVGKRKIIKKRSYVIED